MNTNSKADLTAAMTTLAARLAYLNSLPAEPEADEDGNCVVWFRKQFQTNGVYYTYAAVRVPSLGNWFVSGSRSFPQGNVGCSWEKLIEWITSGTQWELWLATGYEVIATSVE